jgi:predicted RNase H-like HicB family nuclease
MTSPTDDAVRHYLELPYRIELRRDATDDERPWRAIVEDLPGCEVRGTTPPDAVSRVPAVMAEWVASAQAAGCEVPEPRDVRAYSGKLLVRMPQSLHAEVALAAERDHVSINAYINSLLAADVHWRRPAEALPDPSVLTILDDGLAGEAAARDGLRNLLWLAVFANCAMMGVLAAVAVILLLAD